MAPTPAASTTSVSTTSASTTTVSPSTDQDPVAIIALVLAAGAFLAALLQVIIEYITSSSVREKCSRGALGGWAKYTKTGWDIRYWRLHVVYPQINLGCPDILQVRLLAELQRGLLFNGLPDEDDSYGWRDISRCPQRNHLRLWHVWYGARVFMRDDTVVSIFHLPMKYRRAWLAYLWRNRWRRRPLWARASWANMVECFGVNPTQARRLVLSQRELADAIPTAIDAPIQTTTLSNLGLCCFALGLREVEIDVVKGTISARNQFATMSTFPPQAPGLPPLISLSGDLESLRASATRPLTSELVTATSIANGKSDFILFGVASASFWPYAIVYGLQNQWDSDHWNTYTQRCLTYNKGRTGVGNLAYEAEMAKRNPGEWSQLWMSLQIGAAPSIIQALAFLPYINICSGYPKTSFLAPYHAHLSRLFLEWWQNQGQIVCRVDQGLTFLYNGGGVKFMRENKYFDLTGTQVETAHGMRSWILHSAEPGLNLLDTELHETIANVAVPLPILDVIGQLLKDGLEKTRQDHEDSLLRGVRMMVGDDTVLEAAIWFTLYTVERRIEAFWGQLDPRTAEEVEKEKKEATQEQWDRFEHGGDRTAIFFSVVFESGNVGQKLRPAVASFLGLWITLCHEVDPFALPELLTTSVDRILDSWQDDDLPCIIEPEQTILEGAAFPKVRDVPLRTRREFFAWANEGLRRDLIRSLIPWLQLRGMLVYYYLQCFGDSSKVAMAESSQLLVQMA